MAQSRIPIYEPTLGKLEKECLLEAFSTGRISGFGPHVDKFENQFAEYVGRKYAVSTFNGTVALSLALAALDIGSGSRVLTADYTYVATANSIKHSGAEPVFFDANPDNLQPSSTAASTAIDSTINAILFPHLYGYPSDLQSVVDRVKAGPSVLIEDCSEILGSTLGGRPGGNQGLISTYSFFGNKTITTGEGGMVVTDNSELAERLRLLRNQGAVQGPGYHFREAGFNFRMTNLQAALGIAQLSQIEQFLARKSEIYEQYKSSLSNRMKVLGSPSSGTSSYWLVAVVLPKGTDREALVNYAQAEGIDLRPGFVPMHQLPFYESERVAFPEVNTFADRVLLLPSFPSLTNEQVERVARTVIQGLVS